MSLLMDALKRAEEEKARRLRGGADPTAQDDVASAEIPDMVLDAEPDIANAPTSRRSASANNDLSLLDNEFFEPTSDADAPRAPGLGTATTAPLPPLRGAAAESGQTQRSQSMGGTQARLQAQNVFIAGGPKPQALRKGFLAIIGISTLASFSGLGYYVWKNTRPVNSWAVPTNISANVPRAPVPAAPTTAPLPVSPAAPAVNSAMTVPKEEPTTMAAAPTMDGVATSLPSSKAEGALLVPTPERKKNFGSSSGQKRKAKPDGRVVEISVSDNPGYLQLGQLALQDNDLEKAASWFTKAQQNKSDEIPALFGLATVDLRRDQPQSAAQRYLRILELDPRNTASEVLLLSLQGKLNADEAIDRLNTILEQDPNQPLPNFVLGNLYAGKSRWQEAQQAYFKAYQRDPGNPDYIYNLAVSLEHLDQLPLARQYYQQVLDALQYRAGHFDSSLVKKRLLTLAQ